MFIFNSNLANKQLRQILIIYLLIQSYHFQNPDPSSCVFYLNKAKDVLVIDNWQQSIGRVQSLSADIGGRVVAVSYEDIIWTRNAGLLDDWVLLDGKLRQISMRNNQIIGCTGNQEIYYRKNIAQKWAKVDGQLKMVIIDEFGALIGIDSQGIVSHKTSIQNSWTQLTIPLKQVDMSYGRIVGVNAQDDIYYKENINVDWVQIPGKMSWISINERGILCALDSFGNTYLKRTPLQGEFKKISGNFKQIDCKGNFAWAVNSIGSIFRLEFQ